MSQHSGHQHIIQLLSNLSTKNKKPFSSNKINHSPIHSERNFTLPLQKLQSKQDHLKILKSQIQLKSPWKGSGLIHKEDPLKRLNHKHELDNWQISRIQLSKRSYNYPKQYKGIKIPQKGKQFDSLSSRDKQGHLPYLYPNEIKKYESLKQKLTIIPFKVTNSTRHDYFGFGTHRYFSKRNQKRKSQFITNQHIHHLSNLH